jgi:hypothetical protein
MGRPINKKFFGNKNLPSYGSEQQGSGVGGEGIATIAKNNTGTLYTTSTTVTGTMTAPQIKGGVAATVQLTTNAVGNIATVTLLTPGSGYTSAPTALVTPTTTGTNASFTVALTSNRQNALSITSYLTTGSSAVSGGDIIKQESSRRYLVQNSQGRGQVKLSAGVGPTHTLTAGNMHLVATDGGGATYYVMKLTAHKAVVVNRTSTSTALISTSTIVIGGVSYTGGECGWTLGAATGTNQVTLGNA